MCGIVGALFRNPPKTFSIESLSETLRHRGPDDEGYVLINPTESLPKKLNMRYLRGFDQWIAIAPKLIQFISKIATPSVKV